MTKTCGNCRKFGNVRCGNCKENYPACGAFESKITNGDKIRQMSNEELATTWSEQAFLFAWCYDCMEYCKDGSTPENRLKCKNRMLNWLNAPAESEVEDE